IALLREILNRESDRRVRKIGKSIDAINIDPLTRGRRREIDLVLVVCGKNLNGLAENRATEILCGHFRREHGARAAEVRVESGLIIEYADFHSVAGDLGSGRSGPQTQRGRNKRS